METKKIIECLEMCAEKLGCQRYIVGNCEENVRIGNVLDEAAERLEELEEISENWCSLNDENMELLRKYRDDITELKKQLSEKQPEWISVEDEPYPETEIDFGKVCEKVVSEKKPCVLLYVDGGKYTHWMRLEPPKPKEPTFKDVFLEKFPEANFDLIVAALCVHVFFPQFDVEKHVCRNENCEQCWSRPYFKEEGGE